MKYKEFKKAIKELGLGLKFQSYLNYIEVVNKDDDCFATIKKYEPSSFEIDTDNLWMTDDLAKRAEFAKIVTEFATTPIEEREYGPKTQEPRYQVHLGDNLNLVNGVYPLLNYPLLSDKEAKSSLFLWSEQELAELMKKMPNLAWHKCLIDTKKEKKDK